MFHSLSELGRDLATLNAQTAHYDSRLHRRRLVVLWILLNVLNVVVVIPNAHYSAGPRVHPLATRVDTWVPRASLLDGRELHLLAYEESYLH